MKTAVQVYWNRHKRLWSVRSASTRRVESHVASLVLSGCEFRVSTAGRQRVLDTGKRNVHAVVCGTPLASKPGGVTRLATASVSYNPFRQKHFSDPVTSLPILRARYVIFTPDGKARAVLPEFGT